MMCEGKVTMPSKLFRFYREEAGAVTVDWVVLTGAIVGLAFIVLIPIAYSADSSATTVGDAISNQPVGYGSNP